MVNWMRLTWVVAMTVFTAAPAYAGVHPPEAERALQFLVQDWTIEGFEADYRENCSWYANQSFVVCEAEDRTEGDPQVSVSIFGWSEADKSFTYHHYSQNGRSRSETCFTTKLEGLVCMGERRTAEGLAQSRSHIWPVEGGAEFRNETSVNGGPWVETARLKYVPRRPIG